MKIFLLIVALSIILVGCEDPSANKTHAITSNASTPSSNSSQIESATAKGESLAFTPENSKVLFTGSKITGKHDGGFASFAGQIDLVNAKPEESSVQVNIETASVFTDADGLTKHLQTSDFFEVEKFPKAVFKSTKVAPDPSTVNSYTVTGDLELRGIRKSITFPATIVVEPAQVSVNAEFAINRKDFGIVYAGKADDLIRDNVVIKLDLTAPRKP